MVCGRAPNRIAFLLAACLWGGAHAQSASPSPSPAPRGPFPWTLNDTFPLPPRPFIPNCDPTNYPLNHTDVVFDWDVNCGMDNVTMLWTSKVGGYVADWSQPTAAARTVDPSRGLARLVLSNGKKVVLPYNITPSAHPEFTLELVMGVAGISASGFRLALTSETTGTVVPARRGRAVMVYDSAGAGTGYAAWCINSTSSTVLPIAGGL